MNTRPHQKMALSTVDTKHKRATDGLNILAGDPKKAIVKLSIPMVLAMSVQTIYNFVDAVWVAGMGPDALGAVGFFFPFFFMLMAIATGIGIGAGSAISRYIGAKSKSGADKVAVHTIVLMIIFSIVLTIPFIFLSEPIFIAIGAGRTIDMVVAYAEVMFAGTIVIFFTNIANAILRAEGDAKRAMWAMLLGGVMNIVLDPIFIYTFGLGVAGAAWATIISMAATAVLMFNWLFLRKDTFVSFVFRGFRFERSVIKDIFQVGIPASVMQLSMSFTMLIINIIIVGVGGEDGVAVFSTSWRVVMIAILPLLGIATAVVSVTGFAYGKRDYWRLETSFMYAIKIGVIIEIFIAIATFVFAPWLTAIFTRTEDGARIAEELTLVLRIMVVFYPPVALGIISSSMFQGIGKGINALMVTLLRTIILQPPLTLVLAYTFGMGLAGIWWGLVIGNTIGVVTAYVWAKSYLRKVKALCDESLCDEQAWAGQSVKVETIKIAAGQDEVDHVLDSDSATSD